MSTPLSIRVQKCSEVLGTTQENILEILKKEGITNDPVGIAVLDAPTTTIEDLAGILEHYNPPVSALKIKAAAYQLKSCTEPTVERSKDLRPIQQWNDQDLLENFIITRSMESLEELDRRAKHQKFVVLKDPAIKNLKKYELGKEEIDLERTLRLLKDSRKKVVPGVISIPGGFAIVYRIIEFSPENRIVELCPLCLKALYRNFCEDCVVDFSGIGDDEKAYIRLIASSGKLKPEIIKALIASASKGLDDLRKTWPSFSQRFDELKPFPVLKVVGSRPAIIPFPATFITSKKLKDESERNIIEFSEAPWGLGFGSVPGVPSLFPVQRFILKCAYNIPLDDSEKIIIIKDKFCEKERFRFSEIEYLDFLYNEGRINIKNISGDPKDPCQNLLLVMGRRSTKTHIISIIVAYETYKLLKRVSPQEYYGIMPDDVICLACIATKQEEAFMLLKRIRGHLERLDYFDKYRYRATANDMLLNTQRDLELYAGNRPSIKIVSSPCSSREIRGNNIITVLDEMAYFIDETIYDAVTPSVAKFNAPDGEPHGRIICASSPAFRSGKFFELYKRSMEKNCQDSLMIQVPTWEVDITQSPDFLKSKYTENPTSYMAEYGAQFKD